MDLAYLFTINEWIKKKMHYIYTINFIYLLIYLLIYPFYVCEMRSYYAALDGLEFFVDWSSLKFK